MFVQRRRKRAVKGLFAAFGESMPQVDDFLVMLRQHEEHDPLNDTERHCMWEHYVQLRWPNATLIPTFPHTQYHQLLPNV